MNIKKKLLTYFLIGISCQIDTHYTEPVSLINEISTTDELYTSLESKKPTIIKLYSQNCPYCTMFNKTFEETAKKHRSINFISADGKKLNAPKVVADLTNGTIRIPGYPSILFIKNGKIIDHQIGGNPQVFDEKIKKSYK